MLLARCRQQCRIELPIQLLNARLQHNTQIKGGKSMLTAMSLNMRLKGVYMHVVRAVQHADPYHDGLALAFKVSEQQPGRLPPQKEHHVIYT